MSKKYQFGNTGAVVRALNNIGTNADKLHVAFCDMLEEAAASSKQSLLADGSDLAIVFAHAMPGLDRPKLMAWVEAFTPLRVKTNKAGRFEAVRWSAKHVKAAKRDGRPVFDIENARERPWYEFERKRTAAAAAGNLARALDAVAREVARTAHDQGKDVGEIARTFHKMLADQLVGKLTDEMISDKHQVWCASRDEAKEAAARQKGAEVDELDELAKARQAKAEEIARAMASTAA